MVPDRPNRLLLSDRANTLGFIWVAVSSKGTIVKIDTETGEVRGEYRTAPEGQPTNPSRTTVDLNGNVWTANRDGSSVVHVGLIENGQCVDRNRDGQIQTSTGLGDVRPWADPEGADTDGGVSTASDECVLHYTKVSSSGTRHVSVDRNNDVWVSGTGGQRFDLVDGQTGEVKRTEPSVGYGGYGGLIDGNGVVWSARPLLRWDTSKPLTGPNGGSWTGYDHDSYGLCIDPAGNVWNTSLGGNQIRKFAPDGRLLGTFQHGAEQAQGCVVDRRGHVWVAHSLYGSTVGHLLPNGTWVGNVTVGQGPTGVAVDTAGKVWATNLRDHKVARIDPSIGPVGEDGTTRVGEVDFTSPDLGGELYNYGDMTGSTLVGRPATGTWAAVYDSETPGAKWGMVDWSGSTPDGSALTVGVASSEDGATFGRAVEVSSGARPEVPAGRYLRVEVTFARGPDGDSPVLDDLTVSTADSRPPVAEDLQVTTPQDQPVEITLRAADPEGGAVTFAIADPPAHATLSAVEGATVTYTPTPGYTGPDRFTFTATDAAGAGTTAAVEVTVTPKGPSGPDCTISGTDGDDFLVGTKGDDIICGKDGDDVLIGKGGDDQLFGDGGDDLLIGGEWCGRRHRDDRLASGKRCDRRLGDDREDKRHGHHGRSHWKRDGNDRLFGGPGDDVLIGGDGHDRLKGHDGDDRLDGGRHIDRCSGGKGRDLLKRCEHRHRRGRAGI